MVASINAAAAAAFPLFEQGFFIDLNWLGQLVKLIVEGVGLIGVGVIVFALVLKAITTPFDIYQRVKMRKQNLIMKKLQPELEKLQKQYANDKQTYSMKMYELQKKNGYSMLGACLPMIISFVILIVAITAFQSYAQYANLAMYEKMTVAYNDAVLVYAVDGSDYLLPVKGEEPGEWTITPEKFGEGLTSPYTEEREGEKITYTIYTDGSTRRMRVESDSAEKYLFYTYNLEESVLKRDYYIDIDKLYTNQQNEEIKGEIDALIEGGMSVDSACFDYIGSIGSKAAAENFRTQSNPGFLWVKNVWYPDVSYNHPVQDYQSFKSTFRSGIRFENKSESYSIDTVITEGQYNSLTADLAAEKEAPNGYFVMILISIGLMLLSQFIMMRSSKEANQYQTVDGQGATSQKVMLVVLPLMFAVFGFLWSAAFTIYNIISSAISIIVTLLTNLIIGKIFEKREEEELKQRYTRTAPWKQNNETNKKRKK